MIIMRNVVLEVFSLQEDIGHQSKVLCVIRES